MRYTENPPHTEGDGFREVAEALNQLRIDIGQRHVENTSSLEVVEGKVNVLIERVDGLAKGFPDGDPDGHRRLHEALARKEESRAKFYEDLRLKLVERGLWALIVMLGTALCFFVTSKIKT
jgi:hypothetical protein